MRRWLSRIFLWPFALVGALLASGFFLIQQEPVQQYLAQRALKIVNRQIAGTVSVDYITLKLHGALVARNLVIKDDTGAVVLTTDRARVWLAPWDLVLGRVHVLKADLEHIRGRIVVDSSGSNLQRAFATLPSPEPDTTTRPLWIRLDRLTLGVDSLAVRLGDAFSTTFTNHTLTGDAALTDSIITYDCNIAQAGNFSFASNAVVRPYSDTLWAGAAVFNGTSAYVAGQWAPAFPALGGLTLDLHGHVQRRDLTAIFAASAEHVGQLKGDVEIENYADSARVSLGVSFTNLVLSYWLGDSVAHAFNGRAALTKSPSSAWSHDWRGRIELDSAFYGAVEIAADVEAELYENAAALAGEIRTNSGAFNVRLRSDGLNPDSLYLYGRATLAAADLHAFFPQVPDSLSPLSGQTEFELYREPGAEQIVDATLVLGPVTLGRYDLDSLAFHARIEGTHFKLDSTRLRLGSASALLFARGDYTESITTEFTASIPQVADFRDLLRPYLPQVDSISADAELDVVAAVTLTDSTPVIGARGTLISQRAAYGGIVAHSLTARCDTLDTAAEQLRLNLRCDSVRAFNETITPLSLSLAGSWAAPAFTCALAARQDTFKIAAAGALDYSSTPLVLTVDELALTTYNTVWHNDYPIEATFDSLHYEIAALVLRSDYGVLRATGYLENPGVQDLALEFSGLRTSQLAPILRTTLPDGDLNLRVQITGPDSAVAGRLELLLDSLTFEDAPLADRITLIADLTESGFLTATASYLWYNDTTLTATAALPARFSMQQGLIVPSGELLAGKLLMDSLDLDRLRPWLSPGTLLDGYLSADLQLSGSVSQPDWSGDVHLVDGFYRDTRFGIAYKWIVLDADLRRDSLIIHSLRATSRGTMTGSGFARLGVPWPQELSLNLDFDKFEAVNSRIQQARLDGDIRLTGPFDSLTAEGRLTVEEGQYRLTQSATKTIETVNLDSVLADLRGDSLEAGFNADAFYSSLSHDLTIVIPGNFWIRGAGLNLELAGQLRIQKNHYAEPTANGEIAIRKGTVKFYGQELRIAENSTVRFDGPADSPELNISAIYSGVERERSYEVTVALTGTPDHSLAEFSGKYGDGQAMSSDEAIQKLLPFAGSGEGGFSAEQSVIDAASGQVSDIVGKASGLDVFEFRPGPGGLNDLSSGQLELGTYVTDRLFIRVFQPIEDPRSGQKVSIDYRLLDWMKLTAEQESRERSSSSSSFTVYLQFEWR